VTCSQVLGQSGFSGVPPACTGFSPACVGLTLGAMMVYLGQWKGTTGFQKRPVLAPVCGRWLHMLWGAHVTAVDGWRAARAPSRSPS
jgi:hypothetical protein